MGVMLGVVGVLLVIQHSRVLHMAVGLLSALPQRSLLQIALGVALLLGVPPVLHRGVWALLGLIICLACCAIGRVLCGHTLRVSSQLDGRTAFVTDGPWQVVARIWSLRLIYHI